MREANLLLEDNPDIGEVKALGWLQMRPMTSAGEESWQLAFVALCEASLLVYACAPSSALDGPEFWTHPRSRYELLRSR